MCFTCAAVSPAGSGAVILSTLETQLLLLPYSFLLVYVGSNALNQTGLDKDVTTGNLILAKPREQL